MDNCKYCDGCGEVEIEYLDDGENVRDSVGCPLCIQLEKDSQIETMRARITELEELLSSTTPSNEEPLHSVPDAKDPTEEELSEYLAYANSIGVGSVKAIRLKAWLLRKTNETN